jgi:hypothetical protein
VAARRACSIQAIEAVSCLWTQGSTGIEPGTLSHREPSLRRCIMSDEFDGLDAIEKAGIGAALYRCRALAAKIANELRNKRPEHFVDRLSLADIHTSLERAADVLSRVKQCSKPTSTAAVKSRRLVPSDGCGQARRGGRADPTPGRGSDDSPPSKTSTPLRPPPFFPAISAAHVHRTVHFSPLFLTSRYP